MNNLKKVYKHLNKEEMSVQKIELAMEFSSILKQLRKDVGESEKQAAQLSKLASAFVKASNPDISGVPKNRLKKVEAFFKDYSKKANELGIDVKSTMFYKEYTEALGMVGKVERAVNDIKASKKLVR